MPRLRRVSLEGALYYVTTRSEPTLQLFRDSKDVDTYLQLLSQYKLQHQFRLFAYALCADQIFLCLQVGRDATISEIMHDLNSRYTKLYDKRYQLAGHLFQGRYKATVVEKENYLLRLTRYLHTQPNSVASSLSHYRAETPSWIDTDEVLSHFAEENPRQAYETFLQSSVAEEMEQLRSELQKPFVGSPEFVEMLRECSRFPRLEASTQKAEPELERVPVRIRRGGRSLRFLTMVATVGFLSSVLGNGVLSSIGLTPVQKRLEVIVRREATPSTHGAAVLLPANQMAPFPAPTISLPGTSWEITIRPNSATAPLETDRLRFDGHKVSSSQLMTQGFSPSNYTVTFHGADSCVWETMQTGPAGEIACWRGEWDGRSMRGIMTRQKPGAESVEFNFIGSPEMDKPIRTASET